MGRPMGLVSDLLYYMMNIMPLKALEAELYKQSVQMMR